MRIQRWFCSMIAAMCFFNVSFGAPPKYLSVQDAVLLSLRMHPDVLNAALDRVVDRFRLAVQHNQFWPQYTLSGSAQKAKKTKDQFSSEASINLKTKLGTSLAVSKSWSDMAETNTNLQFQIKQPLLRGFGVAVNQAGLSAAEDQEFIGQLNLKQTLVNTINHTLSAYWAVIKAEQDLKVQRLSLKQTRLNLKKFQIKVRVGQMARASLAQQKTALLSGQRDLKNMQNQLETAHRDLLLALGLNPDTKLKIQHNLASLSRLKLPRLTESITYALQHNMSYLMAQRNMRGLKRAIQIAQDQQKPQLDASMTWSQHDWQTGLTWSLPIHDMSRKQQLVEAKINYKKSLRNLEQTKRQLIIKVRNSWYMCRSQLDQIRLTQQTVSLTKSDYYNALRSRLAGINSTYEVIAQQKAWIDAQIRLSAIKILYLNTLTQFHAILGDTLDIWNVALPKYGKNNVF